jgi:urease accessory protein
VGRAALLLLADGRFPAGAHAHSGGIEAAHAAGHVHDLPTLDAHVRGRLATAGVVEATFTARAAAGADPWPVLDDALDVRLLSPRVRSVSRALGRQLLRTGRQVWRDDRLDLLYDTTPDGVHQPVALGAVAAAAGLTPLDAAYCGLHHLASGLATAALRLLGLDPFLLTALLAGLDDEIERIAQDATTSLDLPLDALPAFGGPLAEILAEDHATWEVRLFAS